LSELVLIILILLLFSPDRIVGQLPLGAAITAKGLQSPFPSGFEIAIGLLAAITLMLAVIGSFFPEIYSTIQESDKQSECKQTDEPSVQV
jgi:membrane protein implicated in regulation of membrane protease activity